MLVLTQNPQPARTAIHTHFQARWRPTMVGQFSQGRTSDAICALSRARASPAPAQGKYLRRWPSRRRLRVGTAVCFLYYSQSFQILITYRLVIHALRAQSGEYGLSAFLPAPQRAIIVDARNNNEYTQDETLIPRLPLQREGDFQLQSILADRMRGSAMHVSVNVRQWTLRLLERYRFVLGA